MQLKCCYNRTCHVPSSQRTCPSRGRWSWHICGCSWHKQVPTLTVTVRNSSAHSCACGRAPEERRSCLKPVSSHPALTRLSNGRFWWFLGQEFGNQAGKRHQDVNFSLPFHFLLRVCFQLYRYWSLCWWKKDLTLISTGFRKGWIVGVCF